MPRLSLLQPQEIEVFFILPALRRDLAKTMKEPFLHLDQKSIAKRLGITEPAVSQYLNNKRATKVVFSPHVHGLIRAAAPKIVDDVSLIRETQFLLSAAREELVACKVHEELVPALKGCKACHEAKGPTVFSVK
ncbi:MAG: hypothetical protein FJY86_03815 [Candidatus Diapherotrites archaeon]|uniref:Helix-turn-helix domain-containing protein n=1 Tax=Candidatus Iainarchaeum sp. TaxID=3101447 RepID=A0A8T4C7C1_9ARCH|nr:hypothetical protein [Candidatus Diapherotrites archaeon]